MSDTVGRSKPRRRGPRRPGYHGTLPGWKCPHNHSRQDLAVACAQREAARREAGKVTAPAGDRPQPTGRRARWILGAALALALLVLGLIFMTHGLIFIPAVIAAAVLAVRRGKIGKIPGLAVAAGLIALIITGSAVTWGVSSGSTVTIGANTHSQPTASSSTPSVSTGTTLRYSSAQQVVAALNRGGLPCAGARYNTPAVSGATSETLCNLSSSELALIDVFRGNVSKAMVLKHSASTGTEQIFSVVGPNWWVQVNHAYASRVRAILEGRIIAGPWHPQAQSTPSPSPTITHSAAPPPDPTTAPAAPPPAPTTSAAAPPPASCYPTTSSGHCYEPGEYCRTSDRGTSGVAGDGEKILCEDNNGWRWEPV